MRREKPARFQNYFAISAEGRDFDVDAYLAETTLTFDEVWRRADRLAEYAFPPDSFTSGITKVLGDGFETPFCDQQEIAERFIEERLDALRRLGELPGVETFSLTVQTDVPPPAIGVTVDWHPPLLRLALEVGLCLRLHIDVPWETPPSRLSVRGDQM